MKKYLIVISLALFGFPAFAQEITGSNDNSHFNTVCCEASAKITSANWIPVNNGLPTTLNSVQALQVIGTSIFAGTINDGIFRSDDNGNSWIPVNTGMTGNAVNDFAVLGNSLFAATSGGGVFRSDNNGNSWTAVNNNQPDNNVEALLTYGNTLFAGTLSNGIYKSLNNGVTWIQYSNGLTGSFIKEFAAIGTNIFAATYGDGVFVSVNGGLLWTPVNTGLTNLYLFSIAEYNSKLYAGTYPDSLYLSVDSGSTWTHQTGVLSSCVYGIAEVGSEVYVATPGDGVLKSSDSGITWIPMNQGLPINGILEIVATGTDLFASPALNGVYRYSTGLTSEMEIANNGMKMQVFPNPVSGKEGKINIDFGKILFSGKVEIFSLKGNTILSETIEETNTLQMDINNVSSGIYFIKAGNNKELFVKKLVIQ